MNLILHGEEENYSEKEKFRSEEDESSKGLIMWSEPTYNVQTGSWVFFVGKIIY